MDSESKCSRCEKTLDTTGNPRWCKACRAKYQREYRDLESQMTETRGYAAGLSAMREYLAENFARYSPIQTWNGQSIAKIIRDCAGPEAVKKA